MFLNIYLKKGIYVMK